MKTVSADNYTDVAAKTAKMPCGLHGVFLPSFHGYKLGWLKNDIVAGIVVAALSIPVAMGYAQVAGLPPVYGLYASILPVLGYVLFCSSHQLIYGIDSAASAVTGSIMAALGIAAASDQAVSLAPVLAFCAGVFLMLFSVFKLGRFAGYISLPVMSGFITGISLSIIWGQIPKVLGITTSGSGFLDIGKSLFTGIATTNWISLLIGVVTIAALLVSKKFIPKVPMALIVLVIGTGLTALLGLDSRGVAITGNIPSGFPPFGVPEFWNVANLGMAVVGGLVIAIVIFSDSLLDSNSFAIKGGYKLDNNKELRAFSASNFVSAFFGSSPTSASVSRTAASLQFRGKTQVASLVSALVVALVVLFFSAPLYYMPQPLLSGIIIAALIGVIDIDMLKKLVRRSKAELLIWAVSAVGVLVVGALVGVLIGVVLSFIDMLSSSTAPPQAYLGVIDGRDGFFDLSRNKTAHAVREDVVIYRFSSPLYFANINLFQKGLAKAAANNPKSIIVDASAISDMDITAAGGLKESMELLQKQGVRLYFAAQIGELTDIMEKFGMKNFVQSGHMKKTIDEALAASQ